MNQRKTYLYLLLTFTWSWVFWAIGLDVLSDGINQESIGDFLTVFFVGVYGPTVSAVITTLLFDGYNGLLNLLRKLIIWNVPVKNYLYLVFLPLIFVSIGLGLYQLFIDDIGPFDKMAFLSIPTVLWAGFYAGPLGEELGWRGFLLPQFQKTYSNLKSAVLIGAIWFVWHIPLFWAPFGTLVSGGSISVLPVITYFIMITCLSVIITWLVKNSNGSVLIAILFHLSINAGIALLFFPKLNMDFKTVHLLSSVGMLIVTGLLISKNKLETNNDSK